MMRMSLRMSLSALVAVATLSVATDRAAAAPLFADFDDVAVDTYAVGASFTSGGVTFNVLPFDGSDRGGIWVRETPEFRPVGSGHELWNGGTFFEVELEGTPSEITLSIGTFGGSNQVMVNGETREFQTVDHLVQQGPLAGVSFAILEGTGAHETVSKLQLSGPIDEFAIAGYEMGLDNFAILPEPSAAVLLVLAAVPVLSRRRRRR